MWGAITDNGTTTLAGATAIYVSREICLYSFFSLIISVEVLDISGMDAPALRIKVIVTNNLNVLSNVQIDNDLYVGNGLVVGSRGIYSQEKCL
ncbi:MAG: hypothetical protein R3B93_13075 [Bacteroidia bacterium]